MIYERHIARIEGRALAGRAGDNQSERYFMGSFDLGETSEGLKIEVSWDSVREAQMPLILFSPDKEIRIIKASEGSVGPHKEVFLISESGSTEGVIPGIAGKGEWKFLIYKRRFSEDLDIRLDVWAGPVTDKEPQKGIRTTFDRKVINDRPGWYEGELHVHSSESTGRTSVHEVVETARERGLDFLGISDHFAASHWVKLEEEGEKYDDILLMKSMEVSGDRGHACVHGLDGWELPLVDDNEEISEFLGLSERPSMTGIARDVHAAGGIMSINHSLSGLVGWRYHEFDYRDADLFEAWCLADGPTRMLYPVKWDSFLLQGYHMTGVGSSDSHDSRSTGDWMIGRIRNVVHAESLSREGIMDGLRKGRSYIALGDARMKYTAVYEGKEYQMGDEIPWHGGKVELHAAVTTPFDGNLFIIQSGDLNDVIRISKEESGKEHVITLDDEIALSPRTEEYVRLEFHEETVKPLYYGMAYRDHETMRILTNPVWIEKEN